MRVIQSFIATITLLSVQGSHFVYSPNDFSDFFEANRVLEPTSPILGPYLVKSLKDSKNHPADDYHQIIKSNESLVPDLQRSVYAYVKTLKPGLENYCGNKELKARYDNLSMVEHAAIPNEVVAPLRSSYVENINESYDLINIEQSSLALSSEYQEMKYSCAPVTKLRNLELKLEKVCLGLDFCINARKLNSIISSAEAAYPRIQYSINGFTKYVYGELLKEDNLSSLLKDLYETELEWIQKFDAGVATSNFIPYVVEELSDKYHVKPIFLALAYSKRNMPSLDTEYAIAPKKALLLETYFWHFKDVRNRLSQKKYLSSSFSYYVEKSPGFYHFLTAALLGCEARLAGHDHLTALMLGFFSKLGYKTDKFFKAYDSKKYEEEGASYIRELLKKQGFYRGVKGGYEAGIYGSRVCGDLMRANKKLYRKEIRKLKRQFKKEVKIIEEKYKGRKKAVFKDYVREKRRVEEVIRRKERIRLHPNYALLRQEKRMMLREIKKNYFGEINEVNDLIEQEVLKLSHDQELKNLISKQKRDIRAVDLSRSY